MSSNFYIIIIQNYFKFKIIIRNYLNFIDFDYILQSVFVWAITFHKSWNFLYLSKFESFYYFPKHLFHWVYASQLLAFSESILLFFSIILAYLFLFIFILTLSVATPAHLSLLSCDFLLWNIFLGSLLLSYPLSFLFPFRIFGGF